MSMGWSPSFTQLHKTRHKMHKKAGMNTNLRSFNLSDLEPPAERCCCHVPPEKDISLDCGNQIFESNYWQLTTIPMLFFSPLLHSSMASSTTRFMKGSKPRRTPETTLPPFSFTEREGHEFAKRCADLYGHDHRNTLKEVLTGKPLVHVSGMRKEKWWDRVIWQGHCIA